MASIKCLRFLLRQGLHIRGHDESETSSNKGTFLEILKWVANIHDDYGKVVLKNASGNNQMTAPLIQKEIINACTRETTKTIIKELGSDFFGILADESSDMSQKEQMALCLRYVNKFGEVTERFIDIVHIANTISLTLKSAIESLLMEHSLNSSRIRKQGYDGASNMQGSVNGLKTLIMKDTPSAYYIHCFAHQLQLTLVVVAKKNKDCVWLFDALVNILNLVKGSSKRKETLQVKQIQYVAQALQKGELETGKCLNQELGLKRLGDTMKDTPSAYYIHCFAHQLQLTLVVVAKKNKDCVWLFDALVNILNLVKGSSKRKETLQVKQIQYVAQALQKGELETGKCLNQELGLKRPGDTSWGSHFKTILNVLSLFHSIIDVLEAIDDICTDVSDKIKAEQLMFVLLSFDFIFVAHLMMTIFEITNELNITLQRRDQDIVNAMMLVDVNKRNLQKMRDDE